MRLPALFSALFLLSIGCRPAATDSGASDSTDAAEASPYDLSHLMRVEITLDEGDWDTLCSQTRSIEDVLFREDCQAEPFASPYTWFEASATIDGQTFERIEIRKKGFIGSLSEDKPGIKLDLGEFDKEANFLGMRRLTLNNAVSDPALVRQCLVYATFAEAGIPASRCSLAQVTVNGEDLGIYVNVEPIREEMLAAHFDDPGGNLYEGTLSDFRPDWTGTIEKKTNEDDDDWSDIEALVEAASAEDDALLDALAAVIDLDAFFRFWATEVLVQHGDGYAGNTNNFQLYFDPEDGLGHFIPWGVDMTLGRWEDEDERGEAVSLYAAGLLANRLIRLDEGRQRYEEALSDLLTEVWDEDRLTAQIDTMAALIEPELSDLEWAAVAGQIEGVRTLIAQRRGELETALESGSLHGSTEMRDSFCFVPTGEVDISFATTWSTLQGPDPFGTGSAELYLDFGDGTIIETPYSGAVIGTVEDGVALYMPVWLTPTEAILVYAGMSEDDVAPGVVDLDLTSRVGALMYLDAETMEEFQFVSYIVGDLTFEQAGTTDGAAVEGTLVGQFFGW